MSRLPNNEVGISDILDYRECPQRFGYAMRRHMPMPDRFKLLPDDKDDPPDRENYPGSYGSAIHDCIEVVEQTQCDNKTAIDTVWPTYQHWLEPDDADRLDADLDTYRTRATTGYRLIGTELELRTPLMQHEGETIFFRGRVDNLLQRLDNPAVFLMRDYKSSRWPKSEEEVHRDLQQWSYNWLVHENFPECESLVQIYDQLRYGDIPTRKSPQQRVQIKAWLIRQVTAILNDDKFAPKMNDWCAYCPLIADCRVTWRASDHWRNKLDAIAPQEKQGRAMVMKLNTEVFGFQEYVEQLPKAKVTLKLLEKFVDVIESTMKAMPADEREALGYTLTKPRQRDTFDAEALRQIHGIVGDDLFHLIGLTKKSVEEFYGSEEGTPRQQIEALAVKKQSSPSLKKKT